MRQQPLDFRMVRIDDITSGTSTVLTFAEFRRDNAELCEDLDILSVGWGFTVGGGAAPVFEFYRIA